MGHNGKNPDRWPPEAWRAQAETVGEMYALEWPVWSRCQACGLSMRVSLKAMIKLKGPAFSLWNLNLPCRREGCNGLVDFEAKPPMVTRITLRAAKPTGREPKVRMAANWL